MTDYIFYREVYRGALLPDELSFSCVVTEAQAYVDCLTHDRAAQDLPAALQERVQKAVCAVAETLCQERQAQANAVSSETVGNHARSYFDTRKTPAEWEREKRRRAGLYLQKTGLLYGGLQACFPTA